VIIFEPFLRKLRTRRNPCEAKPVFVPLVEPDWHFDADLRKKAVTKKTRAIVVNSPHNPSGHVFSRRNFSQIAAIAD